MQIVNHLLFSPWLNSEELDKVDKHTKENFIFVRYKNGEEWYEGYFNERTHEMMNTDQKIVLTIKFFELLIGNPIHTFVLRPFVYLVRAVVRPFIVFIKTIAHLVYDLSRGREVSIFDCIVVEAIGGAIWQVVKSLFEILRSLYYGIGMELAIIGGILFDPLRGRERYALMEKKLNHGHTRHDSRSFIWPYERKDKRHLKTHAFFLAVCMQPWEEQFVKSSESTRWGTLVSQGKTRREANLEDKDEGVSCCLPLPCCFWSNI